MRALRHVKFINISKCIRFINFDIGDSSNSFLKAGSHTRLFSDSLQQREHIRYCLRRQSLLLNDQAVSSTSANKRDCSYDCHGKRKPCECRLSHTHVYNSRAPRSIGIFTIGEMRMLIRYRITKANKDFSSIRRLAGRSSRSSCGPSVLDNEVECIEYIVQMIYTYSRI